MKSAHLQDAELLLELFRVSDQGVELGDIFEASIVIEFPRCVVGCCGNPFLKLGTILFRPYDEEPSVKVSGLI